MRSEQVLIDVSRLIWRFWRGGLPTGIDRVCLAYVDHFGPRARAVVQWRSRHWVLSRRHSTRLFRLFDGGSRDFRRQFLKLALSAIPSARSLPEEYDLPYFNIGHTGLDDQSLCDWVQRARVRAIYFIHDLIPILYPEYCRAGERAKHERRIENVLSSATGIIANSQATIDDVANFAAARGLPTSPEVAAWIAGPHLPACVTPRRLERPHFLVLGTIEARKNHRLLLEVWKRLAAEMGTNTPLLVIVGQRGWEAVEAIAMLDRCPELKDHLLELGRCSDDELAGLIAGARALLMPSFAEGFGLPVAEALEIGTPVIASDLSVFREFAGDIPLYLDPLDGPAWKEAICDFVSDSIERERQLKAIPSYRAVRWSDHFEIVEDWLQTLS
jgi:glycosyltransferase involved in cell wall biosynthesis